jgi:hypothetical protein
MFVLKNPENSEENKKSRKTQTFFTTNNKGGAK